jgi:hypothetical protein
MCLFPVRTLTNTETVTSDNFRMWTLKNEIWGWFGHVLGLERSTKLLEHCEVECSNPGKCCHHN